LSASLAVEAVKQTSTGFKHIEGGDEHSGSPSRGGLQESRFGLHTVDQANPRAVHQLGYSGELGVGQAGYQQSGSVSLFEESTHLITGEDTVDFGVARSGG